MNWVQAILQWARISGSTLTVILAGVVGILAGVGAVIFTWLIDTVSAYSVESALQAAVDSAVSVLSMASERAEVGASDDRV